MPDRTESSAALFSADDLLLINNALNEICNGVDFDDAEFATRLGTSRGEAMELHERIRTLLAKRAG